MLLIAMSPPVFSSLTKLDLLQKSLQHRRKEGLERGWWIRDHFSKPGERWTTGTGRVKGGQREGSRQKDVYNYPKQFGTLIGLQKVKGRDFFFFNSKSF